VDRYDEIEVGERASDRGRGLLSQANDFLTPRRSGARRPLVSDRPYCINVAFDRGNVLHGHSTPNGERIGSKHLQGSTFLLSRAI
jgi:hypothetical protein